MVSQKLRKKPKNVWDFKRGKDTICFKGITGDSGLNLAQDVNGNYSLLIELEPEEIAKYERLNEQEFGCLRYKLQITKRFSGIIGGEGRNKK